MANTFNDSSYVDFFVGTQSEYDALVQHDKEVEISGEGEKILKDGALYHTTQVMAYISPACFPVAAL